MEHFDCFECGGSAEHNHHVIPRSKGGTRTVPLCVRCHALVHDEKLLRMSQLAVEARKKAKAANGGKLPWRSGPPKGQRLKVTPAQEQLIRQLDADHEPIASIARLTGLSRPTIYSVLGR